MSISMKSNNGRAALLASTTFAGALLGMTVAASAETILVWSGYPEMAPFYEHVAQGMKAKYPDLEVKVEAIALREHEKRVAVALSGGTSDQMVIEMAGSTARRYLENELLSPAPDAVSAFVKDAANFGTFFSDYASYDGKVFGVPLFRGQAALYYNTDMFAKAGLTEPPKTMADYSTYAEKLTQRDANGAPTVSGWSMRLSGGGQGVAEKFWINLYQYGGSVVEQAADGKWKANYASEAGRATLKQYLDMVVNKKVVLPETPADADAFERQQTAMFIRESWVIGDIAKKAPDLKYATTPLPKGSIALPTNLYVKGDSQAAWDFAQAANEPENLVWLLDNVGWLPNRANVDFSGVLKSKPALAAFVDYPKDYTFFSLPTIGPVEEILTKLAARLTNAYTNPALAKDDAAIDAFLKEAADETNSILAREDLLAQ